MITMSLHTRSFVRVDFGVNILPSLSMNIYNHRLSTAFKHLIASMTSVYLLSIVFSFSASAQTCEANIERHAVKILGQTDDGTPNKFIPSEIYGNHNFAQKLDNGWVFRLGASRYGWKIYLFSADENTANIDLTQVTPPFRTVPNPREIEGWHFRNAANTGINKGDVNAPQHLREFFFSTALIGTGGFKSSKGADQPPMFEADPNDGRGWLKILDFGLTDLEPSQKAKMNYLKFKACLTWPKTDAEKRIEANAKSPIFLPAEKEIFGSCGVDFSKYTLKASKLPRLLSGDIDGDGAIDTIAQIERNRDRRPGLAVCRAGSYLDIIGMKDGHGFARATSWKLLARDSKEFGYEGEPDRTKMDGDMLVFENPEKYMNIYYWADGKLKFQSIYHYIEP